MNIQIQNKLKTDPNYIKYLRENSYWYKILSRNPELFETMISEMKEKYSLRPTDKINNVIDSINLLDSFINNIKD